MRTELAVPANQENQVQGFDVQTGVFPDQTVYVQG